eukprot:2289327-Amphidinium_carterae.1
MQQKPSQQLIDEDNIAVALLANVLVIRHPLVSCTTTFEGLARESDRKVKLLKHSRGSCTADAWHGTDAVGSQGPSCSAMLKRSTRTHLFLQ